MPERSRRWRRSHCFATHWQVIGRPNDGSLGVAYVDLDSIHQDGLYRVATFLTVYDSPPPNSHNIKLDRIAQQTAFDCDKRMFSLITTRSYFEGKQSGASHTGDDWTGPVQGSLPGCLFTARLDVTCNAPLAPDPEPAGSPSDAPATVRLPTRVTPD